MNKVKFIHIILFPVENKKVRVSNTDKNNERVCDLFRDGLAEISTLHAFSNYRFLCLLWLLRKRWRISNLMWAASSGLSSRVRRASHAGSHDSVPEKDRQRTLVGEWRSYRQTEVSRLSAGSVDNIPSRPGTYNGVLSTKALLLFVKERNKTCNLTLYKRLVWLS